MDKLALFDIDKTLLKGSKAHAEAFSTAFNRVYGIGIDINVINHHGMTDQQIIFEVLKKSGLSESEINFKLGKCMEHMVVSFNNSIGKDEIIVLEGIRESLEELSKRGILMGLVTGNLEPIARGKLRKVGLNHYFQIGGFGSDDVERVNLVRIVIERAKGSFDFRLNNNVFLFGDTPYDMKAAKEAEVKAIGVATGIYSEEQLKNAGADFVLENLKDIDKILKILEGRLGE